jgi:hypothetical protein
MAPQEEFDQTKFGLPDQVAVAEAFKKWQGSTDLEAILDKLWSCAFLAFQARAVRQVVGGLWGEGHGRWERGPGHGDGRGWSRQGSWGRVMARIRQEWDGMGPGAQGAWEYRGSGGDGEWELIPDLALAVGPSCLGIGKGVISLGHREKGERLGEYLGAMVLIRERGPGEFLVQCRARGHYAIDGGAGGNWTARAQHAFKGHGANCALRWEPGLYGKESRGFLETLRAIPPGEELCWEYGTSASLWFLKDLWPWVPVEVQLGGSW